MISNNGNTGIKEIGEEIEALLREHDIAGCVVLADKEGAMEYLLVMDVSWTALSRDENSRVKTVSDFESPEVQKERVGSTIGLIFGMSTMMSGTGLILDHILEAISKAFKVAIIKRESKIEE